LGSDGQGSTDGGYVHVPIDEEPALMDFEKERNDEERFQNKKKITIIIFRLKGQKGG